MKNQSKIIDLHMFAGTLPARRSRELELALRDFMSLDGGTYYDETENGILKQYYRLKNGICVEQVTHIGAEDCLCYTNLHCHAHPDETELIRQLVMEANAVNRELRYGNFEVDTQSGDIRFRSFYSPGDKVYMEDLDLLLGYPRHAITLYGHRFLEILES